MFRMKLDEDLMYKVSLLQILSQIMNNKFSHLYIKQRLVSLVGCPHLGLLVINMVGWMVGGIDVMSNYFAFSARQCCWG